MNVSDKIYFTVYYLLLIPILRIIFTLITKKGAYLIKKDNSFYPLINFFYKFFKFYVIYLFPIMALILIISKWMN
jgi:uncharacterized Tic20 family protein